MMYNGPYHPLLHPGLLGSSVQDKYAATAVEEWGQITSLPLNNSQFKKIKRKVYFMHREREPDWDPKLGIWMAG